MTCSSHCTQFELHYAFDRHQHDHREHLLSSHVTGDGLFSHKLTCNNSEAIPWQQNRTMHVSPMPLSLSLPPSLILSYTERPRKLVHSAQTGPQFFTQNSLIPLHTCSAAPFFVPFLALANRPTSDLFYFLFFIPRPKAVVKLSYFGDKEIVVVLCYA